MAMKRVVKYAVIQIIIENIYTVSANQVEICFNEPCACCKTSVCIPNGNAKHCAGCIDGFTNATCREPCPWYCLTCSQKYYESPSERICYECKDGFFNDQNLYNNTTNRDCSQKCMDNCQSCTSKTNCTRCESGYFKNPESKCQECPELCVRCSLEKECEACIARYFWNGENCEKCGANCQHCMSKDKCSACDDEFYLNGNHCLPCPTGCILCKDAGTCKECDKGYYLNETKCYECINNCVECSLDSSGYTCKGCKEGYYGFRDSCKVCGHKCVSCVLGNSGNVECVECQSNYRLQNGMCCHHTCSLCSKDKKCENCAPGFYNRNGECDRCPERCAICNSSSGMCSLCENGTYLSEQKTCANCSEHCKSCISQDMCEDCENGYNCDTSRHVVVDQKADRHSNSAGSPWMVGFIAVSLVLVVVLVVGIVFWRRYKQRHGAENKITDDQLPMIGTHRNRSAPASDAIQNEIVCKHCHEYEPHDELVKLPGAVWHWSCTVCNACQENLSQQDIILSASDRNVFCRRCYDSFQPRSTTDKGREEEVCQQRQKYDPNAQSDKFSANCSKDIQQQYLKHVGSYKKLSDKTYTEPYTQKSVRKQKRGKITNSGQISRESYCRDSISSI